MPGGAQAVPRCCSRALVTWAAVSVTSRTVGYTLTCTNCQSRVPRTILGSRSSLAGLTGLRKATAAESYCEQTQIGTSRAEAQWASRSVRK